MRWLLVTYANMPTPGVRMWLLKEGGHCFQNGGW